jgi:hypothetical protein
MKGKKSREFDREFGQKSSLSGSSRQFYEEL